MDSDSEITEMEFYYLTKGNLDEFIKQVHDALNSLTFTYYPPTGGMVPRCELHELVLVDGGGAKLTIRDGTMQWFASIGPELLAEDERRAPKSHHGVQVTFCGDVIRLLFHQGYEGSNQMHLFVIEREPEPVKPASVP